MRLNKLEIKGFKSFRDKTVLEFPDNLTAIVGPNGSGKSNLTEAICFVLGRSRGLRAANLQELIYNGGLSDKPADKAVVSMEIVDAEGSKYKITRIVDNEGRSTYSLNDKRVTRTRIVDIVGDNEYNILLQDDVTKVIEMKPKERREVIDSICGIAEYDEKKAKALKELEKVEKLINETHIVLGEKQGYMNELKKERDEALEYQQTRDEIKKHQASILYKNIKSLEKRNQKLDEETEGLKATKEADNRRIGELREAIRQGNQQLKEINSEIISREEEKSRQRIIELDGEIGRKEDRLSMLNEKITSASEEKAKKRTRRQMLGEEEAGIMDKLAKVAEELAKLKTAIEEESAVSSEQRLEDEIDQLRKSVYELHSQARTLKELNNSGQRTLEDLRREEGEVKKNVEGIKATAGELASKLAEHKTRLQENTSRLSKAKQELQAIGAEKGGLEESLEKARLEDAEKKANLRAMEQASHGLKSAITAVIKIKDVVQGIHGPVFQLGIVTDPQYETALQIAAGDRMQNLVVEDVDVAGKCIDYLRKKQVGRATFLPMDKIESQTKDKPPQEAIGFARDFIKTDDRYRKIFEYVFGNTIIVKDMEDAKKAGIGKWRMVTVEGDLFEASGAITGGHTRKVEIGFSNIDEQEKELEETASKIRELEAKIGDALKREAAAKNNIAKAEMDVAEENTAVSQLSFEEKTLTEKEKELAERTEKTRSRITEVEAQLEERNRQMKELRTQIEEKEQESGKLLKVRGEKDTSTLDKLKDKARDASIEESSLRDRQSLIETQKKEIDDDLTKLEDAGKNDAQEKSRMEDALTGLKLERAEVEKQSAKVIKEIEELIGRRSQVESGITSSSEEIGAIERSFERVNEQINQLVIEKTKNDTNLESMNKEYEKYAGVEVVDKSMKDLGDDLQKLEEKLGQFGSINMRAIETFDEVRKEYEEIFEKLSTLKTERQSIFDFMDKVEQKKYDTFIKTFNVVKENFERIFRKLSEGTGTLTLDNPGNISESGLFIRASPGAKKVVSLDAMSGGEKVLTSAAFLLAVQQYKPSDFYIIDELDAALDKINSIKLTEMFQESDTQFILITHNDAVLKHVNSVIGVSMTNGVSQIVGVKLANTTA